MGEDLASGGRQGRPLVKEGDGSTGLGEAIRGLGKLSRYPAKLSGASAS
jgi:hypothetical protein